MKHTKWASILIILLTFQPLFAQEEEPTGTRFGLGISLFNVGEYLEHSAPIAPVYLTIDFSDKFRLEPIVGFNLRERFSKYSISLGAFRKVPISKFNLLYGLRVGYGGLGAGNDEFFMIAPAIGGEYYFIQNFSIGSEIQIRGLKPSAGDWTAVTNTSFIVRFYF